MGVGGSMFSRGVPLRSTLIFGRGETASRSDGDGEGDRDTLTSGS